MRFICSEDLGMCNCASCDREVMGEKTRNVLSALPEIYWPPRARRTEFVEGRINGRPYCRTCFQARVRTPAPKALLRGLRIPSNRTVLI